MLPIQKEWMHRRGWEGILRLSEITFSRFFKSGTTESLRINVFKNLAIFSITNFSEIVKPKLNLCTTLSFSTEKQPSPSIKPKKQ